MKLSPERKMASFKGKHAGKGRKSYRRQKRKDINVLFNCTKNGLVSIQSNLTFVSSHRLV